MLALCLASLLAGQSADTVLTVRLLRTGDYRELNPILPHGTVGIVAVKAAMTTTAAVVGWRIRKQHPKLAVAVFLAGAVGGSVVAWHNARISAGRTHGQ